MIFQSCLTFIKLRVVHTQALTSDYTDYTLVNLWSKEAVWLNTVIKTNRMK